MANIQGTSYDEVPYMSYAFWECHPDRLATVATLHGLTSPDITKSRVLELGCASGGNLIPMAVAMPDASFVGVDLSPRQIDDAKAIVKAVGLKNITLKAMSITEVGPDLGKFDYILCHGVFSWVPFDVQEKILSICAGSLTDEGFAYVSYNTYPGWHFSSMIREMMVYHVRSIPDGKQRVQESRNFLEQLARSFPEKETHYAQSIRLEVERLRAQTDAYLLHEHLEEINQPMYFYEFLERASAHKLRYVGEARFRTHVESQPPEVQAAVQHWAPDDVLKQEQYLDFLRNRTFRRAVLCHVSREVKRPPKPENVQNLSAMALAAAVSPVPDLFTSAPEEFRTGDGQMRLSSPSPLIKVALQTLSEKWPRCVPIPELKSLVYDRLDAPPIPNPAPVDRSKLAFEHAMLKCYSAGMIEFVTYEPSFVREVSAKPVASPLVRQQAESGRRVVNMRHRNVELTEFERLVVRQLDGERDRDAVLERLVAAVIDKSFTLSQQDGRPITDRAQAMSILERSLNPCLQKLGNTALLVG
jgi:methyltransferase-like protein/cyclopropane fatty-acyl-phospholipid synthase-like methyltransferase